MDFYTALRRAGLGHLVPSHTKQRSYPSRFYTSHKQRYVPQETTRQKQARYGVWEEFRGRTQDHIEPYSPARMKALHTHAMSVFDDAIAVLEKAYYGNQWR
jgi:hypothetical protein